VAGASPK